VFGVVRNVFALGMCLLLVLGTAHTPDPGATLERQWIYTAHPYLPAEPGNYPRGAYLMIGFERHGVKYVLCGAETSCRLFRAWRPGSACAEIGPRMLLPQVHEG